MAIYLAEGNTELNIKLSPALANLHGGVRDVLGSIVQAKVTLDGLICYCNPDGSYRFENLDPGSYTVSFEKEGYATYRRTMYLEGNNYLHITLDFA